MKKTRDDPANLVNHETSLPAPHALQLWVTLVQLHKSPSDKMSAIGSLSQNKKAASSVQLGRKLFSHPTRISKINSDKFS